MYIFFDISLSVFCVFFFFFFAKILCVIFSFFFVTTGVVFVVNNVGGITTKYYSSVFWLCSLSLFIHFSRKNLRMKVNVQTVCFLFVAFSSTLVVQEYLSFYEGLRLYMGCVGPIQRDKAQNKIIRTVSK